MAGLAHSDEDYGNIKSIAMLPFYIKASERPYVFCPDISDVAEMIEICLNSDMKSDISYEVCPYAIPICAFNDIRDDLSHLPQKRHKKLFSKNTVFSIDSGMECSDNGIACFIPVIMTPARQSSKIPINFFISSEYCDVDIGIKVVLITAMLREWNPYIEILDNSLIPYSEMCKILGSDTNDRLENLQPERKTDKNPASLYKAFGSIEDALADICTKAFDKELNFFVYITDGDIPFVEFHFTDEKRSPLYTRLCNVGKDIIESGNGQCCFFFIDNDIMRAIGFSIKPEDGKINLFHCDNETLLDIYKTHIATQTTKHFILESAQIQF
jgi:hypothetical protein